MLTVSAEARVVASFTFVTALVLGAWGSLMRLGTALFGGSEVDDLELLVSLGIALVAVAAAAVAQGSVGSAAAAWARHLAGATVVLAGLVGLAAVLHVIGTF